LLSLVLEGDDDETHEDVHHEERDHDDEDEVEDGDAGPEVVDRPLPLLVRVNRDVQQTVTNKTARCASYGILI